MSLRGLFSTVALKAGSSHSYCGGFFFPPPSNPPRPEGTGVPFKALPTACWAIPDTAAVAMAPTLGTNLGSEVVPCMAKGTLTQAAATLTFCRPGMPPTAPPTAPDELRFATMLKFNAPELLTVPAPVT